MSVVWRCLRHVSRSTGRLCEIGFSPSTVDTAPWRRRRPRVDPARLFKPRGVTQHNNNITYNNTQFFEKYMFIWRKVKVKCFLVFLYKTKDACSNSSFRRVQLTFLNGLINLRLPKLRLARRTTISDTPQQTDIVVFDCQFVSSSPILATPNHITSYCDYLRVITASGGACW